MAAEKSTDAKQQAAPLVAALVKLDRKVNDSNGDHRQWIVSFSATEDGSEANAAWAPADRAPVFPLQITVSGDVGDALELGKSYGVFIAEA